MSSVSWIAPVMQSDSDLITPPHYNYTTFALAYHASMSLLYIAVYVSGLRLPFFSPSMLDTFYTMNTSH